VFRPVGPFPLALQLAVAGGAAVNEQLTIEVEAPWRLKVTVPDGGFGAVPRTEMLNWMGDPGGPGWEVVNVSCGRIACVKFAEVEPLKFESPL
jgi:hypothetical protein